MKPCDMLYCAMLLVGAIWQTIKASFGPKGGTFSKFRPLPISLSIHVDAAETRRAKNFLVDKNEPPFSNYAEKQIRRGYLIFPNSFLIECFQKTRHIVETLYCCDMNVFLVFSFSIMFFGGYPFLIPHNSPLLPKLL